MIFGVYVALPKHILTAKYEIEIHVYSDVTPFYKILIRSTIIIIIIYTILFLWRHPLWRHSLFYLLFTLFFVGKKSYSIPPLKKCEMDTNSIKERSLFPQLNTKKGKKLKCGTRIFRDNLNVSQKATQEKTNFSLRGGISSNTYNPLFQKKQVFLNPWYAGPLGLKRIKNE